MGDEGQTYEAAGVSIAKADAVVERLRAAVESTGATGFGAFAGLYPLDDERLLAASTDSVGTKLILARQRGAASRVRRRPRRALHQRRADVRAPIRSSSSTTSPRTASTSSRSRSSSRARPRSVAQAGCALVGGETAELPGIYREDELDFAGTCVGLVERERLIDGSRIEEGDAVVGFASAGVHANGFTLVRRVLETEDYAGDDLLAPTRLYLDDVRRLRDRADVRGLAHVTGGGILGNLARVLPDGLRAEIDWDAWERPPVFALARAPRRRGRAAPCLQPRDRLRRGRAGSGRRARDRAHRARVIGVLVSG